MKLQAVNHLRFEVPGASVVQAVVLHIPRQQDLKTVNEEPARCIEEVEELLLPVIEERGRGRPTGETKSRKRGRTDNVLEGEKLLFRGSPLRLVFSERLTNPRPTILMLNKPGAEPSPKRPSYRAGSLAAQTLVVRLSIPAVNSTKKREIRDISSYFT